MSPIALILGCALVAQSKPDVFELHGPFDRAIPSPQSVLGYAPGVRHTTYHDQERVIRAIAEKAPDRMKIVPFGKSVEGRPLRVCVVSSPGNMKRIEQLRLDMSKVASGDPGQEAAALAARLPAFVWINECIHGDETASFESGMWLLYNLVASRDPAVQKTLENSVVILNPVYNPDGHERYVVWYNSVATGSVSDEAFERFASSVNRGRANHYRFDMNRDRVSLSQDESRFEVREFLRWNPQVYVDQHGQLTNYFFPPNPMSINANVGRDRLNKWTDILGKATAREFDRQGWLYFVKEEFDFYYAGYTDTWAALSGAIGMTHETDHGATLRELRNDGSIATLRGAMEKHFVSALAVISSAAENRKALLDSYLQFKRAAASGRACGSFQRVIVSSEDQRELDRLERILERHGIRCRRVKGAFRQAAAHDYWTSAVSSAQVPPGSLVVDMAQPQGVLAKSLLEPHSDFESEFVKEQLRRRELQRKKEPDPDSGAYEFYDITGWSLIFAHGLQAWWSERADPIAESPSAAEGFEVGPPTVGYWMRYTDMEDALAAFQLMRSGVRIQVATKDLRAGSRRIPKGSFLIFRDRNGEVVDKAIQAAVRKHRSWVEPIDSGYPLEGSQGPGSSSVRPVRTPEIAVVFGDSDWMSSCGAIWYLMEREFGLPFTPISARALGRDLSGYTCIVVPAGRNAAPSAKLKEWVQAGGCLVVLGSPGWALGPNGFAKLDPSKLEGDKPVTPVPGSLFLGSLDSRSFLSYGFPAAKDGVRMAVPVDGSEFYKAAAGGSVLRMPDDPKSVRLLSGWSWPDDTQLALAGTVWAHVESVGQGSVVYFMSDPTDRAIWQSHWKMLLNAMLFGAS